MSLLERYWRRPRSQQWMSVGRESQAKLFWLKVASKSRTEGTRCRQQGIETTKTKRHYLSEISFYTKCSKVNPFTCGRWWQKLGLFQKHGRCKTLAVWARKSDRALATICVYSKSCTYLYLVKRTDSIVCIIWSYYAGEIIPDWNQGLPIGEKRRER